MIIPWQQLSSEALNGLLEEFVSRDGTDYGEVETSLEARVAQVLGKLKTGEAVVLFTESTGEANIVWREQLQLNTNNSD